MSRNVARQTSRDLHSDGFAMVLTAGFYCDSWAHNVRKVRVVKYIAVYGQIKAADQYIATNNNGDENSKKQAFEQEVLETIEMIFGQDTVERRSWI